MKKVHAETYSGQIAEKEWINGIFIKKSMPTGSSYKYEQARFIRRSDGQFVYCLQPYVFVEPGATYQVEKNDYLQVVNMTQEQWNRVRLLAYYGYGYGNHTEDKWYAVTQLLIWRTVSPNTQIFFTNTMNGTRNDSLYVNEINEINDLISNHHVIPNFNNGTLTLSIGQTISLNDENDVLSNYKITSTDGVSASIEGNTLNITATEIGSSTINLKKSDTKYSTPPMIYYSSYSQDVFSVGYYDPVFSSLSLNVVGAKIKVVKVDSETNSCTPQGQANLTGAKYNVIDSNNNIVSTLTIGDDFTAITDYLPLGQYTIKEVSPSTGYQLDDTVYTVDVNTSDTFEVTVKENVIKGRIKVNKVDADTNMCTPSGNASLVGAIYEVFDKDNAVVDTLITGNDCSTLSKELPYGNYKVKEKTPSTGYNLDTNTYEVTINQNSTVEITSREEILKGYIKITKVDSETNACTPQGQASLIGATFEVLNWNNTIVDTLTIGNDCTATSKLLPLGQYTVREKEASIGYYINSEVFNIDISNATEYPLTVKEEVIKNYISILKQYDYVDGNSTILNAESNIIFEIFYPSGQKYSQVTTDKNGYATIEIPYGKWIFHQVNTNEGFNKIHDFTITVDETTPREHYYNILNNKLSAYLQIVKKDKETGKTIALPNTTFKILNTDTNQFVSQFVGGIVHSTFKTNENGVVVTYLKLEAGNYRIVEIQAPDGYLIDNEGLDFTIGSNTEYKYTNYGTFIVVNFENTPIKGRIEINKKGENPIFKDGKIEYEQIPLQNVEFQIYADEDIVSSDGQHLYYKKGELVSTLITNENGYAISDLLPLGKYYLFETKTHDTHVLDTKEYHFILQATNDKVAIVYETYKGLNIYGDSLIKKINKLQIDIKEVDIKIEKIYMDRLEDIISADTYKKMSEKLESKKQEMIKETEELQKSYNEYTEDQSMDKLLETTTIVKEYMKARKNQKRDFLIKIIDRIEIYQDKIIDVHFKLKSLGITM